MATLFIGISCFYHDSAVCLSIDDNVLFSEQEERHSRVKGDKRFPALSLFYGLKNFISAQQALLIDKICISYYENPNKKLLRAFYGTLLNKSFDSFISVSRACIKSNTFAIRSRLIAHTLEVFQKLPSFAHLSHLIPYVLIGDHHVSHLLSAIVPSGFSDGVGLVLDGIGEFRSCSIYSFKEFGLKTKLLSSRRYPHSLGLTYSAVSSLLGFKVNSGEYKLMGLAPYGKPVYTDVILENIITPHSNKFFSCNSKYLDFYSGGKLWKPEILDLFGLSASRVESDPIDGIHLDIAASLQLATETIFKNILQICRGYSERFVYSGGVALNCKANRYISSYFPDYFIQPASNDAGGALGSLYKAIYKSLDISGNHSLLHKKKFTPFMGSNIDAKKSYDYAIENNFEEIDIPSDCSVAELVAIYLHEGSIVARCSGRSEFGPRALGNRSILADPSFTGMQQRLNLAVKKREGFRPFAPIVTSENYSKYFTGSQNLYMLVTSISKTYRDYSSKLEPIDLLAGILNSSYITDDLIPSGVHVDGSARVQSVDVTCSPDLHALLVEFQKLSGHPILLNTSFNLRGEPIVRTYQDAFQCFQYTDIDVIWLPDRLYRKSSLYSIPPQLFPED